MTTTIQNWDGGNLVVEQRGSLDNPIIFIHGWSCNRSFWQDMLEAFNHPDVILVDLAGHGDSTAGEREWTIAEYARDVATVVAHFDLEKYSLVGHSMGGMVALQAAADQASKVETVIQLDTFVFDYGFLPEAVQQGVLDGFNADFPKAVEKLVADTSGTMAADTQRWVVDEMLKTDKTRAIQTFANYMQYDPRPAVDAVKGKLAWFSGGLINAESRSRYAHAMRSEYILPALGHFLGQQSPGEVAEGIAFLLGHKS